ncbi:MAG: ribonuclease III [Betaproteobacteria bacterium]|jgi:ribonuclease-3|nr:ribonuclease III [Rhodocyclaceae bacterium]MCA3134981.1 ribonuclease III [Rhodocyclaceae bacterium]MCA3143756.1 ribonuclease III [Rhodocyclaceae bacterium]MCA3147091.1 ribonuclease III [Rhodocyclaceae bacterium]MCE2898056.1 ribonuclease III [Betaproteobacteria bacterium]
MEGVEGGAFAGYRFRDPSLLRVALTHRSHGQPHNERLEFVGDAVLNCAIAAELFRRFPSMAEGDLSRLRANLVNQGALASVATTLGIGEHLRLGEGEARSGGAGRPSILADSFEALIGAVFVDGGFDPAQTLALGFFEAQLSGLSAAPAAKDPKTALQEGLQARRLALPVYRVLATHGAEHQQRFEVECGIAALSVKVSATGSSRRSAEQGAAQAALDQLGWR